MISAEMHWLCSCMMLLVLHLCAYFFQKLEYYALFSFLFSFFCFPIGTQYFFAKAHGCLCNLSIKKVHNVFILFPVHFLIIFLKIFL